MPVDKFEQVLSQEDVELAEGRRLKKSVPPSLPRSGICLSGGGIRSATFNLGILQALNELRMLHWFDYQSTVSGGGYIGAWLVANIKNRTRNAGNGNYDSIFEPQGDPIRRLRRYSRYLAPDSGFFSADTWTIVTIWLRNTLLIQSAVIALIASVLLLPRMVTPLFDLGATVEGGWVAMVVSTVMLIVGVGMTIRMLGPIQRAAQRQACGPVRKVDRHDAAKSPRAAPGLSDQAKVQLWIVAPLMTCAFAASVGVWSIASRQDFLSNDAHWASPEWYLAHLPHFAPLLTFTVLTILLNWRSNCHGGRLRFWSYFGSAICGITGQLLFMALAQLALVLLHPMLPVPWWPVVGPAACMVAFSLVVVLYHGISGRDMDDRIREWWSRLGAWLLIYSIGYFAVFFLALSSAELLRQSWASFSHLATPAALATWAGSTITTVMAGRSSRTKSVDSDKDKAGILDRLLIVVPYISFAGILVFAAFVVDAAVRHVVSFNLSPLAAASAVLLFILLCGAVLWWRIDLNEFSMHHFYRNRLVRCYLGSAHFNRKGDRFTDFDFADDFALSCLRRKLPDATVTQAADLDAYDGPYPIINAALNTSQGGDLDLQDRKAESFIFTPHFSGSERPPGVPPADHRAEGFHVTSSYMYPHDKGVSYGTAMSISGAAASPNMGYHTSPAVAFLLTLFNVRLGWWVPNPATRTIYGGWQIGYLIRELFGSASAKDKFLYLSDGGHFDNLGLYELVRRGCRFIVVGDGEEDRILQFESLAAVIRKCWIDLKVTIEIDVDSISDVDEEQHSKTHCVVGRIIYPDDVDEGVLVYLKASITGDEDTDIRQYRVANPAFPHEPTFDQYFSENQFESYRKLGHHVARGAFLEALAKTAPKAAGDWRWDVFRINLKHQWTSRTGASDVGGFSKHSGSLLKIWEELRTDDSLEFLDYQIFPEWQTIIKSDAERATPPRKLSEQFPSDPVVFRKAMYVCQSALQVMEDAYVDLNLDQDWDHPDNRGWMNLFKHWSWSGMFRLAWAVGRSTYGARFQSFCEYHLELGGDPVEPRAMTMADALRQSSGFNWHERDDLLPTLPADLRIHQLNLTVSGVQPKVVLTVGFVAERDGVLQDIRIQDHLRRMGLGSMAIARLKQSGAVVSRDAKFDRKPGVEDPYAEWVRRRVPPVGGIG